MFATSHAFLSLPKFPVGIAARWETQSRKVWNERRRTSEEHELVYEISWIEELGAWRRFLRSQRKLTDQ
jgi:hypothetical protein